MPRASRTRNQARRAVRASQVGVIHWEPIIPPQMNDRHFRLEALNSLRAVGRRMVREFKRTVADWEHKPEFTFVRDTKGGNFTVYAYTNDRIYEFINNGTQVRYATMTNPFQSKTQPGVIDSRPGIGGLAFVSRRRPHPGIEARGFDELIAELTEPFFFEQMDRAVARAVQKSGHAYP